MTERTLAEILDSITATAPAFFEHERRRRQAYLATPEQVAKRAAAEKRREEERRRREEELAEQERQDEEWARQEEDARQGRPPCEGWFMPGPPYPGEVPCSLGAGHDGEPHESVLYGLTWPWEDEDQ